MVNFSSCTFSLGFIIACSPEMLKLKLSHLQLCCVNTSEGRCKTPQPFRNLRAALICDY